MKELLIGAAVVAAAGTVAVVASKKTAEPTTTGPDESSAAAKIAAAQVAAYDAQAQAAQNAAQAIEDWNDPARAARQIAEAQEAARAAEQAAHEKFVKTAADPTVRAGWEAWNQAAENLRSYTPEQADGIFRSQTAAIAQRAHLQAEFTRAAQVAKLSWANATVWYDEIGHKWVSPRDSAVLYEYNRDGRLIARYQAPGQYGDTYVSAWSASMAPSGSEPGWLGSVFHYGQNLISYYLSWCTDFRHLSGPQVTERWKNAGDTIDRGDLSGNPARWHIFFSENRMSGQGVGEDSCLDKRFDATQIITSPPIGWLDDARNQAHELRGYAVQINSTIAARSAYRRQSEIYMTAKPQRHIANLCNADFDDATPWRGHWRRPSLRNAGFSQEQLSAGVIKPGWYAGSASDWGRRVGMYVARVRWCTWALESARTINDHELTTDWRRYCEQWAIPVNHPDAVDMIRNRDFGFIRARGSADRVVRGVVQQPGGDDLRMTWHTWSHAAGELMRLAPSLHDDPAPIRENRRLLDIPPAFEALVPTLWAGELSGWRSQIKQLLALDDVEDMTPGKKERIGGAVMKVFMAFFSAVTANPSGFAGLIAGGVAESLIANVQQAIQGVVRGLVSDFGRNIDKILFAVVQRLIARFFDQAMGTFSSVQQFDLVGAAEQYSRGLLGSFNDIQEVGAMVQRGLADATSQGYEHATALAGQLLPTENLETLATMPDQLAALSVSLRSSTSILSDSAAVDFAPPRFS